MKNNIQRILCIVLLLTVVGCSQINSYQNTIYNDDAKIASQGDSYKFKDRIGAAITNNLSLTFSGFYGKQTIWGIDIKENRRIKVDVRILLRNGKFKICLVDENKEVSIIAEGNNNKTLSVIIPKGKNRLVIIGKDASGEVIVSLSNQGDALIEVLSTN